MEYKLKECLEKIIDNRGKTPQYFNYGIPLLEINSIANDVIYPNYKVVKKYISQEVYENFRTGNPTKGDILIGTVGTLGTIAMMDNVKASIAQNMIALRTIINIDSYWLYYYLRLHMKEILNLDIGAVQPSIKVPHLLNFIIDVPELKIQKKISQILYNIDQKIELNNQMNESLYNVSQEIFKRWFIDFEFPNNEGLNYKSTNGQFKEVNGDIIPVDWQIKRLDEVAECQNGNAFYKDGYDETGIMVVDLGNVNINGSFIYTNADKYISKERLENNSKYNKYLLYKDDLVMVMTDRKATMDLLGKTGKIYEEKEYLLNQRMYRIRSKINVNYLYTVLNSRKTLNELKSKALGSVQKYVNTEHINELKIIVGTDEIMERFSQIVNPIFERIENNILENNSLQELRDTLLPKLMNGKIDLNKIEI